MAAFSATNQIGADKRIILNKLIIKPSPSALKIESGLMISQAIHESGQDLLVSVIIEYTDFQQIEIAEYRTNLAWKLHKITYGNPGEQN